MQLFSLLPHPAATVVPAIDIYAVASILSSGRMAFRYRVRGDVQRIRLPAKSAPVRADELWQHTCFEVFAATKSSERYAELNFSPSSAWAAYAFEHYRYGMQPLPVVKPPQIQVKLEAELLAIDVTVQMRSLAADSFVGFSAVIEDVDGVITHWALEHPRPKADFHDAKGWTAVFQRHSFDER